MPDSTVPYRTLTQDIQDAQAQIESWSPAVRIAMGLERDSNAYYETFFVTLSRQALACTEAGLRHTVENEWDDKVAQELEVLANQIRARIQHIDAGDLQAPGSFA